jgi:hypothetical protein
MLVSAAMIVGRESENFVTDRLLEIKMNVTTKQEAISSEF